MTSEEVEADEGGEESSTSKRGTWRYVIGLVGKPSAGKSTFFNAATKACLHRGGRLEAAVASHPFTTIEPNVGPGFFSPRAAAICNRIRRTDYVAQSF